MLMAQTLGAWTLADLDRLPDDGNKYELVDGELFVTPAPALAHERLELVLRRILDRYVEAMNVGEVYGSNSAIRSGQSEVHPDLSVRTSLKTVPKTWAEMPLPILAVEILSPTTRRRDHEHKRDFYRRIGLPEYWIIDGKQRTIRVVKPRTDNVVVDRELTWHPANANAPLTIDVARYFHDALGDGPINEEEEAD
jgi:Uma2 family endonuclease